MVKLDGKNWFEVDCFSLDYDWYPDYTPHHPNSKHYSSNYEYPDHMYNIYQKAEYPPERPKRRNVPNSASSPDMLMYMIINFFFPFPKLDIFSPAHSLKNSDIVTEVGKIYD